MSSQLDFDNNVFINCPFDTEYRPLLRTLVFTLMEYGLNPRIATEIDDSGSTRIEKIKNLICYSKYSIHDISRMESLNSGDLPRFNMPFELGMDIGARTYNKGKLKHKVCLILEKERYRYQSVISDLAGQDIRNHNADPELLIGCIRNWITINTGKREPGAAKIWIRFNEFTSDLFDIRRRLGFTHTETQQIEIKEYMDYVSQWISEKPAK